MAMTSFTKFTLRFGVYLLIVAYLGADLFLFKGPLHQRIEVSRPDSEESIADAKAKGVVALVFNHHITRSQLDYAIHERLWIEGRKRSELSEAELKLVTYASLGDLIDHQLLRVKVKHNTRELAVSEEEIDERVLRFASRFESKEHLEAAMKSQGILGETALRHRIAARIQQEKYVALRVDPLVTVTDEEIEAWYEKNEDSRQLPERIRVRHIFIATLGRPAEETKKKAEFALSELAEQKKDFPTLVAEISDDPSSKASAGDLGWMSKSRIPADFAEPVFALEPNTPTLIRTKLGWHIVELTGRVPAEPRALEDARPEILAALTAVKRHQAVKDFRRALRQFEAKKIDVFHDHLQ